MKAKGTLTANDAQVSQITRLLYTLNDVYIFIRERCKDGTITDLRDLTFYFQDILTSEQLTLPRALLINVAERAWGHAQINDSWNKYAGFCIPLGFIDYRLDDNMFHLDILDDYEGLENTRFKCSTKKFIGINKHWIILKKFDYGFTLTPEVKRKRSKVNRHTRWAWGRLEMENNIQGAFKTWVKVHNSFIAYFRSQYLAEDLITEAQLYATYKIWYTKLGPRSKQIADAFPQEMFTYLLLNIYKRFKQGKYPKYLPRAFDSFKMLVLEPNVKQPWQWLWCPLFGHVKYFAKQDSHRYVAETVNIPHIMTITSKEFKDGTQGLIFGIKPFDGNLTSNNNNRSLLEEACV